MRVTKSQLVDSGASEWLHELKRLPRKNEIVAVGRPACWWEQAGGDVQNAITVTTPCDVWVGPGEGVVYLCSFCREPSPPNSDYRVEFNPVMTRPYTVTCGTCTSKMS